MAPLGAVHHPLLPPPHCYQLISQLLYLLPQALQRSHLQRVSAPSMAETCQGDRDILLTGSTQLCHSVILQDGLFLQNGDTVITRIDSKKVSYQKQDIQSDLSQPSEIWAFSLANHASSQSKY